MLELDESQKDFCQSPSPNIRLLAPAGSGKTLSLLYRAKHLIETSRSDARTNVCIFAFTRAARDELRKRIIDDPQFSKIKQFVTIDTLNRYGYNQLKRTKSGITLSTTQPDYFRLVNNNLRPIWEKNAKLKKIFDENVSRGRYKDIIELFDSLKESGFRHDSEDFQAHCTAHMQWLQDNGLGAYLERGIIERISDIGFNTKESLKLFFTFWSKACQTLWESALITLVDQKYWTLLTLESKHTESEKPQVPEQSRYHHIIVDEFQDVSPLDLALVKSLSKMHKSSLTVVGDDDQAIYEWRGATPEFILNPSDYFKVAFQGKTLDINYRSPPNIISHSQDLIRHNRNRVDKKVRPYLSEDADIEVKPVKSHNEALDAILPIARSACRSGKPKSLAVMARKKSQILPVQIFLTSNEIPYFAKEDLNVFLGDAFNTLREILETIAQRSQRRSPDDLTKALLSCCDVVSRYPLRSAEKKKLYSHVRKMSPRKFDDALSALQTYEGPLRGSTSEETRYQYLTSIANVMEADYVARAIELIGENFDGLQKHYAKGDDDIFYKDPPFVYLAEYALRYEDDFFGFIEHIESSIADMVDGGYDTSSDKEKIDDDLDKSLHIMTALRAKGKEFDTVVILDANKGIWPIKMAETERQLEQERRLFYVASTRCRERLIIMPVETMLREASPPTPYIEEMNLVSQSVDLNAETRSEKITGTDSFKTSNMAAEETRAQSKFMDDTTANEAFEATLPPAYIKWGGFSVKKTGKKFLPDDKQEFIIKFHGFGEVKAYTTQGRIKLYKKDFRNLLEKLALNENSKFKFYIIRPKEYYEASKVNAE